MGKQHHKLFSTTHYIKGVTLIELLIAITIIGILAGTLVTLINPVKQLQKGRDTQRKGDIAKIQQALEMYRSDVGQYPDTAQLSSCGASSSLTYNNVTYLRSLPCDPKTNNAYTYTRTATTSYEIYACLENNSETANGTDCASGITYKQLNP